MRRTLVWRWAWRELFHGQLWPVVAALALIIACVFALSALAARIESVLTQQGRSMLAADLVLRSNQPLSENALAKFDALGVETSNQTRFGTMAFSDENMQLISVKAVDSNYPLRGTLELQQQNALHGSVQPGELWLEERLFTLLDVSIGDSVDVGDMALSVSGKIISEPELSFNPFSQMPAAMMHQSDVDAAGVVRPGSRVNYRYFFKGNDGALANVKAAHSVQEGQRWIDENTGDRTGDMLDRSRGYLSLTVVLVIIMAAATLLLTCQHYVESRTQTLAMVKSLGAQRRWVRQWLTRQLVMLMAFASVIGLGLGAGLEYLLRLPLADVLPSPLPSYGALPWLLGPLVALLVALPALGIPLIRLIDAPANSVLQSQGAVKARKNPWSWLLASVPLFALIAWSYDNRLMWLVLAALVVMLSLLAAIGVLILRFAQRRVKRPAFKLALSRITRNPAASGAQLGALATSFMLLSIIWLLRTDLLNDWQQTLPPEAPNVFALNIAKHELDDYVSRLDDNNLSRSEAYPVIRGRLVGRNGTSYAELEPDRKERDEALRRELNFTWRDTLPSHNVVLDGEWPSEGGVSVEEGIAQRLGLRVGDVLTFSVNSQEFDATVNSIRDVEWRNMKPNFYFIFDPALVESLPANWLVSFRLEQAQSDIINALGRDFQTVTLLDLRTMSERIQVILRQISMSLSVLAGLAVVSGLLLLLTLLRITLAERQREIMLYRTLGASKKRINTTLWAEYGIMALVSGCMAVGGAELAMAGLLKWGVELPVRLHPEVWLSLPVLAVGLVFITVAWMIKGLLEPLKR
ncbi:ABC transporter permease [Enterovibrio nigricans]|uniref:Putative ABC transport system permease protein n=1 Tax=Enterovibrio nigricans DSM 22720 TaxID=1121868 RepID=A0A1T4U4A9_9GAMM|nr:FtsX-like permease family protein [Enterovibrio nigricans]SKA47440.1 putative ABC transport system permease protein [Enterovibrio nigricans DSM 22720]